MREAEDKSYSKNQIKVMTPYKVLVSTLDRLHFVPAATGLVRNHVNVDLYEGWVVEDPLNSKLLKFVSWILGRKSIIYGFTQRTTPELHGRIYSDFFSEAIGRLLLHTMGRLGFVFYHWSCKVGLWLHGLRTIGLVRRNKYDLLHIRSGYGRFVIPWAKKRGVKVLVDHSSCSPKSIVEEVYGRKWDRTTLWWTVDQDCRDADVILADCDFVKHSLIEAGYSAEKIKVVYMGLNEKFNGLKKWDDFSKDGVGHCKSNPLKLVYTGGFNTRKGNRYFLEAVEMLLERNIEFEVNVIGSVSLSEDLRQSYPNAIKKIHWHGHVSQEKMCEIMALDHVYLFPSLSEGCAKSAFEAMSMGLCVVATEETGLPLVDGEDGLLVKSRSSDSIVEKIIWLIEHPGFIRRAGELASSRIKKYTWDEFGKNTKKVYEEMLGRTMVSS